MLPREAFHVTDVLVVVPWTVAANWSVPPVMDEVEAGEIVTEATEELEGEVAGDGEEDFEATPMQPDAKRAVARRAGKNAKSERRYACEKNIWVRISLFLLS
jgi:hypothetical protein